MRVYHREGAGRPIRVLWTLEEAGLPYELTILSREEAAAAEHRARQPLGRVPVIETDDATLFESAALCLHVAELNPQAELIPAPGTVERALVYQWMFFAMTEIEPPAIQVFRAGGGGEAAAESAAARCQAAIDAVDAARGGEEYLIGHRFSVADIVLSEVARMPGRLGAGQPGANLSAYLDRLEKRPARERAAAKLA